MWWSWIVFKFCRKQEKCFLQMLIYNKKSRLWSDAAQNARCLIKTCSFYSSIIRVFPDDGTYLVFDRNSSWGEPYLVQSVIHLDFLLVALQCLHCHDDGLHLALQSPVMPIEAVHAARAVHKEPKLLRVLLWRAHLERQINTLTINTACFKLSLSLQLTTSSICKQLGSGWDDE